MAHLHRHKHTVHTNSRSRKHRDPLVKRPRRKLAASTDFDMDIDLPLGNGTAPAAGATTTVTGPITVNDLTQLIFQVWYTDSFGSITSLDASTITITSGAGQDTPFQWNFPFTLPPDAAAGDYTFFILGIFAPVPVVGGGPLNVGISTAAFAMITLSAPFTL
jgi:hypothetical protein